MQIKRCKKCGQSKPVMEFTIRPEMADGYRNECKECMNRRSCKKYLEKAKDPVWLEKERTRNRELQRSYSPSLKPFQSRYNDGTTFAERFPEKIKAARMSQRLRPTSFGVEKHHWSYCEEHWMDVIWLSKKDHLYSHKFLLYDKNTKKYQKLDGTPLLTKEEHHAYIIENLTNRELYYGIKRKDYSGLSHSNRNGEKGQMGETGLFA